MKLNANDEATIEHIVRCNVCLELWKQIEKHKKEADGQ